VTGKSRALRLGGAAVLAACLPSVAAAAPILLPSVRTPLQPGPPLTGSTTATAEIRVPPRTTSDEQVLVGIDATGKPFKVAVLQRIRLSQLGDYTFPIPGPIADVAAAPGTDSEPGLRKDAIVWAGFSPGKKTLASRAVLRPAPAVGLLPLRLSVTRGGDTLVVRGKNATGAPGVVLVGPVDAASAATALDATRRTLRFGATAPDLFVDVPRTPTSRNERIVAPLDVRVRAGGRVYRYRLGDGDPLDFELRVPIASAQNRLQVEVMPVPPLRLLSPPGGARTWAAAGRRGLLDKPTLLELASRARLTVARAFQYRTFLANPDPRGRSTATYVYSTAARPAPVKRPETGDESGGALRAVLVAVLATAGAGALVVLWANS
jgi:hypothetical protein